VRSRDKTSPTKQSQKQAVSNNVSSNVAEINQLLEKAGIKKLNGLTAYPSCGNIGYVLMEDNIEMPPEGTVRLKSVASGIGLRIDERSDGYAIGKDDWSITVPSAQSNSKSSLSVSIRTDEKPTGFPAGHQNCDHV
jgi:hypothetical protein